MDIWTFEYNYKGGLQPDDLRILDRNKFVRLDAVTNSAFSYFEEARVQYLEIEIRNYGEIPRGEPGGGNHAWLFLDEIIIR